MNFVDNIDGINVVCNNCVGAALMEQYNVNYENPFAWCTMQPKDYFVLMTNWDSLDFTNVETFRLGDAKSRVEKSLGVDNSVLLVLDKRINVFFMHHMVDPRRLEIKKENHNAYYCDMVDYVRQKWIQRVERMKFPPQFLLRETSVYCPSRIQKFIDLDTKYQKYLVAYDLSKLKGVDGLENCYEMEQCSVFDAAERLKAENFLHTNRI